MKPFLSIIVITYNSSKFILEALNSIKNQEFLDNAELIVSDDCSSDDTVSLCTKWLDENNSIFFHTEILTVTKNSGLVANCNRACKKASGVWLKIIAGDDALLDNCIKDFMSHVMEHPNEQIVTTLLNVYEEYINDAHFSYLAKRENEFLIKLPKEEQLKMIARDNAIAPNATFIRRAVLEKLNWYDEKYKYEDLPLAIRFIESGGKYYYIAKPLVAYRRHGDSVTGNRGMLFRYWFVKDWFKINKDLCFKYLPLSIRIRCRLMWALTWLIQHLGMNNKSWFNYRFYHTLANWINKIN